MGEIRITRIYEPISSEDGTRILVDRLWPRGISKEKACLDYWWKEVTPSSQLRKWFGHDPQKFLDFRNLYRKELDENKLINEYIVCIRQILKTQNLTLLYAAKDPSCNHALILKEWFEEMLYVDK
ncbi:DUF488 domain-containing protein [Actinomyces sp. zg-332]|uniref:DUF488 domain-containing protein n=1 Tax=Actinomyces sp. zg-332 TaxID=2708340 RepID=UPI001422C18C|nr:DUF488 domain-containing protein [Actinomyces sp. zg-332]QPK93599.1 DUF488 domain-containing protein [Actinomyces sp. zg-332]